MIETGATPPNEPQPPGLDLTLGIIAEQLRGLANNGLHFTDDPYQIERFHKVIDLSAQLLSLVDSRPLPELRRVLREDITLRTPLAVAEMAVFDPEARVLLMQRSDSGLWALPGGASDLGEAPATSAVREVWEETGILAQVTQLIGVFDSRLCGQDSVRHLYHLFYAGRPIGGALTTSIESTDVGWFAQADIPWEKLAPGHPARLRFALQWQADPTRLPYLDDEAWSPPAQHG